MRPGVVLRPIHEIVAECREPQWLIHKILEANVIAILAGPRSTFKSFVALDWTMRAAKANHPAVILSAEGAGLDRRVAAWMGKHGKGIALDELPVYALERALNLNLPVDLGELSLAIDALPSRPDLIVVDTFSKFSAGLDENSNSDVSAYLASLTTELRDQYDASVLLVAHSGHGESRRPRGASALMANPDCEYIVTRPDMERMEVCVSRDRFKDSASFGPLGYQAEVIDLGRFDSYGERLTSLALQEIEAPMKTASYQPQGKAQKQLLTILRAANNDGPGIWTIPEMRDLCRKGGMHKSTARSAVDSLCTSGLLTPTVGGHRLSDGAG